jgi:allophanate hydrolase
MRGQPLTGDLEALGARYVDDVETTDAYRMVALPTTPPKPGVLAVGPGRGGRLRGERWQASPAGLGRLLASLPAPLALGRVALAGGGEAVGFLCAAADVGGAPDITALGGWRAHLAAQAG